jgi:ABC-type Mn2+/Zn2+ transport system permease subunit
MAAIIGSLAVCSGLILAFQWDLPPGPLSVGVLVLGVVAAAVINRWRESRRFHFWYRM